MENIRTHTHTHIYTNARPSRMEKLKAFESDAIRIEYYQSIRDIQRGCIANTDHTVFFSVHFSF